jgi:hypothetical protein
MMNKFSILAVIATVATLSALPAQAAPGGFAPGGNGPGGCGLCGPGGFAPNPGGGGGGGGGAGGGNPASPGDPFIPGFAVDTCDIHMGRLRPVKIAQIRGVDEGDSVAVVEVCADDLQRNISKLRPHIAQNEVLDDELAINGFDAGDVIGVKVRGGSVTLFVH